MNNIFIYNNSFKSLLILLRELFLNKIRPYNIKDNNYNKNMFDNLIYIDLNSNIDIFNYFISTFNFHIFRSIYYVYLSNEDNKELIIYYYLLNYFKYKDKLDKMRNLKCVSEVLRIRKKVSNENHKFKGITRFRELNNKVLYSEINPSNNILDILSIHFKNRLKEEYWIIKDVNHNLISIYNKEDFKIYNTDDIYIDKVYSKSEEEFSKMWQIFYKTISIKERKNDRCRMNFMPKKYWHYIIEMDGNNEENNNG